MANKSSIALEDSLTGRVDVGYGYASGTTPKDKDFERVKEEMRNVNIDWFGSNVFTELSNKVQPVKDHIAKYYPNVTFESDKLDHYAVSLMLAEKSNREVSFGIGFLKEVMDIAGTGFSQGDLDADLAGAMGWDVQQALSAGLLIDQNPTNTDAYNEWKKIPEYLDPDFTDQSDEDATTGENYFNNIKSKIQPTTLTGNGPYIGRINYTGTVTVDLAISYETTNSEAKFSGSTGHSQFLQAGTSINSMNLEAFNNNPNPSNGDTYNYSFEHDTAGITYSGAPANLTHHVTYNAIGTYRSDTAGWDWDITITHDDLVFDVDFEAQSLAMQTRRYIISGQTINVTVPDLSNVLPYSFGTKEAAFVQMTFY